MPYIPKQYDSAKAFLKAYSNLGNIVDPMDAARVNAYNLYDDFYHNRPETFQVTRRGSSDIEIYLPSTKKIIGATARFLGVDFGYVVTGGNASAAQGLINDIWDREGLARKFVQAKRSGLTRGDSVWHITADGSKPDMKRVSIHTVHPSCYFPIEDPSNPERLLGVHLVDLVQHPEERYAAYPDRNRMAARRQTYRKENGRITSETRVFELGGWDDRHLKADELKPISIIMPKKYLPAEITSLPVYVVSNNVPDGSTYGMSQIAGVEYLINALNQSMTYEDLSLVLQGLGVYVTTAGAPKGPDGKPTKYQLHPGNVVEIGADDTFQRVTGVASVAPFQDHLRLMDEWATEGLPDMATGNVDVAVAESGIALALKMGPVLAENQDKQLTLVEVWNRIGYDLLNGWLPAFENLEPNGAVWKTTFGDPMPQDRVAKIEELIQLKTAGLILIDECRREMEKLGYKYSANLTDQLLAEAKAIADSAAGTQFESDFAGLDDPNQLMITT